MGRPMRLQLTGAHGIYVCQALVIELYTLSTSGPPLNQSFFLSDGKLLGLVGSVGPSLGFSLVSLTFRDLRASMRHQAVALLPVADDFCSLWVGCHVVS